MIGGCASSKLMFILIPENGGRDPKGKDRLPTPNFQGRNVSFREGRLGVKTPSEQPMVVKGVQLQRSF